MPSYRFRNMRTSRTQHLSQPIVQDEPLLQRSGWKAAVEVGALGILFSCLIVLFASPFFRGNVVTAAEWMLETAGPAALESTSMIFGVYLPVLLGFYALVIGGQLITNESSAVKIRCSLGYIATVMTGLFTPALALAVCACFFDPPRIGTFLVILPLAGLMYFLTIRLGGFIVFERGPDLGAMKQYIIWAKTRSSTLRQRSDRPKWLVISVNSIVAASISLSISLELVDTPIQGMALFALYLSMALMLSAFGARAVYVAYSSRTRSDGIVACVPTSAVYLAYLAMIILVFEYPYIQIAYAMSAILIFVLISMLLPRATSNKFLTDWSLHGAAVRSAASTLNSRIAKYEDVIAEIRSTELPTQRSGVENVIHALKNGLAKSFGHTRRDANACHDSGHERQ